MGTLPNGAFEGEFFAQHILNHLALHRADLGVALGEIVEWASEEPDPITFSHNFRWYTALLKQTPQLVEPLRNTLSGHAVTILIGEAPTDPLEEMINFVVPLERN
jgi:hypothetical protein